jgi:hypothetical protein
MFKKISILIIIISIPLFLNNNLYAWDKINESDFTISVNDIAPWGKLVIEGDSTSMTLNRTLWTMIQQMMIRLGSLSLIIMTIWWWYMIIYHGQDELLSKWKYIFMSWIIALVVSLGSYYMVALLRYILYSGSSTVITL